MKTGLVLEGGAMRGMFTAGVLDVLMEHGIAVDGAIGVSAGAVFGCNYKSHQIGRTIRYNTEYCKDKRYASFGNLLRTGNLYSEQFCYHTVPEKLDPFDAKTFREDPMDFFVVCTDVRTGDPIYHKCRTGDAEAIQWMQASASMPLAAKIVKIGHYQLLDGGIADSIPVRFFESIGYKRNLIVLTQPKDFVKKKNKMLPAIRARYLRYPAFVEAVADRHERYNEPLEHVAMLEQTGQAFVIRPPIPLEIGSMERDPAQLRRVYDTGRAVARSRWTRSPLLWSSPAQPNKFCGSASSKRPRTGSERNGAGPLVYADGSGCRVTAGSCTAPRSLPRWCHAGCQGGRRRHKRTRPGTGCPLPSGCRAGLRGCPHRRSAA